MLLVLQFILVLTLPLSSSPSSFTLAFLLPNHIARPTSKFQNCKKTNSHNENTSQRPYLSPPSKMTSQSSASSNSSNNKFQFSIDRGGTFTDVHCILPSGSSIVSKLLSEDPDNYPDAPTEGIRRILSQHDTSTSYPKGQKVATHNIASIRMGTTVATNALLERRGEKTGLIITKGFRNLLEIGNQSRQDIFDLTCKKPGLLYDHVEEIDERVMLAEFVENDNVNANAEDSKGNTCLSIHAKNAPQSTGTTNEKILILTKPQKKQIHKILTKFQSKNIKSIAIVLAHSYTFTQHEEQIAEIAKSFNYFTNISQSHEIMAMVKMVSRGHTACAAAYLTPVIMRYLSSFKVGFDDDLMKNVRLSFMKSDGGLTPVDEFGGHQAILSGPAGGVIGYAKTSFRKHGKLITDDDEEEESNADDEKIMPVIGFDMGGTSTDVSRYDGSLELVFETTTAGVSIQAPQLDINTVAAGGGSRLFYRSGMFYVGPESAGAHPGPVCYRKNGYLAVTDANLVLGRILPNYFPTIFGPNEDQPLDLEGARNAFNALKQQEETLKDYSIEEIAYGFLKVANEAMCRPIRNLTQMKGYDITTHKLACFGGAGPQHACAIAKALGMKKVFVHRYGGILSA